MILSTSMPMMFMLMILLLKKKVWQGFVLGLMWMTFFSLSLIPQNLSTFFSSASSIDLMSALMVGLTFFITALMFMASQSYYMNSLKPKLFSASTLALCYILITAYSTNHMINFFIMFEASLIPTLILILSWGYQPERLQAGTYLMLYMISSSLPLLFSLLLLSYLNGHLFMSLPYWGPPSNFFILWWLITILPFLIKTPIYSVHLWLPKAHVEAPVSGSMILAGILLKLGSYGLFRIYFNLYSFFFTLTTPILVLSIFGACIASALCLRQSDIKALIAYSSVSHMGLVTAGIFSMNLWGWSGALLLIIAHGLISSALFSLANMTYETSTTRNMLMIKGLMNLFPALTIWWFILAASNLGAPPSINMLAEVMLLTATISFSKISSFILFFMIMFTTGYCLILFSSTQYGPLSNYINSWNMINKRNYSILFIHALPAIIFFLKPEILILWV